ncbi:MAG: bifunctional 5,10-methylenetetrahydrofolate dehydrogenase/5,10-methenyltetrahydrofolate cyclohydrolase [Candidatus Liptonbacteria bacterium]
MEIIDGKKIAGNVLDRLRKQPLPKKFLAGVVVGDDPASLSFQALKKETAKQLGVDYRIYELAAELGNDGLRREVGRLARQKPCGGILVQLPLPPHVSRHYVLNAIPREKDVDVLSERSLGAFYTRRNPIIPPVAGTVEEILRETKFDLREKVVAVVGLGLLIGRPIAHYLMGKTKKLYLLGKGSDFSVLEKADLVVVGAGSAGLIKPSMLKNGAAVIDFGYSTNEEGKLAGDFDSTSDEAKKELSKLLFYTPTPGGTGPILVAKLMENFYTLNKVHLKP